MKNQNLWKLSVVVALLLTCLSVYGQDYEVDPTFNPQFDVRRINTFEITTGGKILVGGEFTIVNGAGSAKIVRLNPDGTTDTSFSSPLRFVGLQIDDEVRSIKTLPDGKILIGGKFPSLGTDVRIARLNSNGTLDSTLTTRPTFDIFLGMVKAEPLSDGKFLACGPFRDANGTPKNALARFNFDGSLDNTFTTVLAAGGDFPSCSDVKVLSDGKILVVGFFYQVNGTSSLGGVKLNPDGSLDTSFNSTAAATVRLGNAGEFFANYGGSYPDPNDPGGSISYTGLEKRDLTSGSVSAAFNCNSYPTLPVPFAQSGGKTIVAGGCKSPWNNAKQQFARFNSDLTFDSTLDRVDFGTNGAVNNLDRQPDGKYLLTGQFSSVNGLPRTNMVRLQPKTVPTSHPDFDFNGDGKADLAIFRPSDGYWYIYMSTGEYVYMPWGISSDKPVAADYDNDGKTDIAVFRNGDWWIVRSADGSLERRTFGQAGDTPLAGHFSLDDPIDDKVDMVLRSPFSTSGSNVRWQFKFFAQTSTTTGIMPAENASDKLVIADLDGDSIDEYGFFRDGYWKTIAIGGTTGQFGTNRSQREFFWGTVGDIPVAADYDGDGQDDYAVFRPSTGTWWFNATSLGVYSVRFGAQGDVPVPADYDGDGKTDIAIYRNGQWWRLFSSNSSVRVDQWGTPGDLPIPAQGKN
ncbi:MAG TPA: FG-GAP-like repeat-containing protein [Pyrinomonadaceae bacterium]|nr:FG-GAP-like repeat-containing protein [Pyrinomonadaceae bacterium]